MAPTADAVSCAMLSFKDKQYIDETAGQYTVYELSLALDKPVEAIRDYVRKEKPPRVIHDDEKEFHRYLKNMFRTAEPYTDPYKGEKKEEIQPPVKKRARRFIKSDHIEDPEKFRAYLRARKDED